MFTRLPASLVLITGTIVLADVVRYEGNSIPTDAGWTLLQSFCDPQEWVQDGCLFHHVELCDGIPPPGGQQLDYQRTLTEFVGTSQFFVEWRMETDGDRSELPWGGPTTFTVWSTGPVDYRFSIASDQAELNRDNLLPIILVDIGPGVPHTHRLEVYGDTLYAWFIDGVIVDSGLPEGQYPDFVSGINIRTKTAFLSNTTKWDYIRWGTIPQPASGDFDSDGVVDQTDVFFFVECLLGPDADGPGCRWADMNGDGIADGADIQLFAEAMLGP